MASTCQQGGFTHCQLKSFKFGVSSSQSGYIPVRFLQNLSSSNPDGSSYTVDTIRLLTTELEKVNYREVINKCSVYNTKLNSKLDNYKLTYVPLTQVTHTSFAFSYMQSRIKLLTVVLDYECISVRWSLRGAPATVFQVLLFLFRNRQLRNRFLNSDRIFQQFLNTPLTQHHCSIFLPRTRLKTALPQQRFPSHKLFAYVIVKKTLLHALV